MQASHLVPATLRALTRLAQDSAHRSLQSAEQFSYWLPLHSYCPQIQARLGSGHCNLVNSQHVVLTPGYLGIVMEFVAGGNLTTYVSSRWSSTSERGGLFLSEGEARYFFQVSVLAHSDTPQPCCTSSPLTYDWSTSSGTRVALQTLT